MELSKADQEQHDKMLKSWIDKHQRDGYTNIRAALPGLPNQPEPIGNSIPDMTAKSPDNRMVIGEVKTCGDLDNDHTQKQLGDYVATRNKVMLLVPVSCQPIAKQVVQAWGFAAIEIWQYG